VLDRLANANPLLDVSDCEVEGELLEFDDRLRQAHELQVSSDDRFRLRINLAPRVRGVVREAGDGALDDRLVVDRDDARRSDGWRIAPSPSVALGATDRWADMHGHLRQTPIPCPNLPDHARRAG